MRRTLTRLFCAALLGSLLTVLPACNTIEGVGDDMQSAGDALGDAARNASD